MEAESRRVWTKRFARFLFFMALPLAVFYWMMPFWKDQTIGNDYPAFSFLGQLGLQYPLLHGEFPLYIPGGTFGRPAAFLTLGQMWHPISHIASHLPGYWSGWALDWNTLYRLLSLGLTHLILYLLLRRVRVGVLLAFLISFVTVYNLRMLDMFRYGASLESYTAFLCLCAACAWHFITPTRRAGPTAIILSTYLLICSGHPQMMYYGLIGAAFIILTTPFFIPILMPELRAPLRPARWYYMQVGLCVAVGMALSAVYVLPYVFDFLVEGGTHIKQDMYFSSSFADTVYGSMANLFSPLMADVHGAFGGSALPMAVALVPLLFCLGVRVQRSVIIYWLAALAVFLWILGRATPFYAIAWKIMPLSSSMRAPGRLGMVFPPIIMWLLVWLVSRPPIRIRVPGRREVPVNPLGLVALMALVLWIVGNAHAVAPADLGMWAATKIRSVSAGTLTAVNCLGGFTLLCLAGCMVPWRSTRTTLLVLAVVCTVVQTTIAIGHGTWIGPAPRGDLTAHVEGVFYLPESGQYEGGLNLEPNGEVKKHFANGGTSETLTAWVCLRSRVARTREEVYNWLRKGEDKRSVILETDSLLPTSPSAAAGRLPAELTHRSANRMKFGTFIAAPGFLVFTYPYRPHWRAFVNGERATIYRANGVEQAVQIPAGQSTVEFRFWSPATFCGLIASCFVACGLFIYLIWQRVRWRLRILAAITVVALASWLVLSWYNHLYTSVSWSL